MAKLDADISERISFLRFLLIYGIIVLHVPPYVPLSETGGSWFDFFKALMQHAVFRCSVPMLTFVSGFLVFRFAQDKSFRRLFKKKFGSIFIPLVLFNVPVAIGVFFLQYFEFSVHSFSKQMYPFDIYHWVNAITGMFGETVNYPLGFLRDLFAVSLLAPVFGLLLRQSPWLGFVLVVLFFWNNLDGGLVLRNMMPINFYMGGMLAVLGWNPRRLDDFWWFYMGVFLLLCVITIVFQVENRNYLRLLSPVLIWPAVSVFVGTGFGCYFSSLSKYSFAIFLTHGPLLLLTWIIYKEFASFVPYVIFWIFSPVMIVFFVIKIYPIAYRFFPRFTAVALGGR